jgi:hypothetical protein
MMIDVQINNINIRYEGGQVSGAQIYFNGSNEDHSISLSGYVPLTAEEFNLNLSELQDLVKAKIVERLQETPAD